jgi:hypothetical protein
VASWERSKIILIYCVSSYERSNNIYIIDIMIFPLPCYVCGLLSGTKQKYIIFTWYLTRLLRTNEAWQQHIILYWYKDLSFQPVLYTWSVENEATTYYIDILRVGFLRKETTTYYIAIWYIAWFLKTKLLLYYIDILRVSWEQSNDIYI